MARIPAFRKAVVAYLATNDSASLETVTQSDWMDQFHWLDRSGLALPLATRLLESEAALRMPGWVIRALTTRLCDNERRMKSMLNLFDQIRTALADAYISFCCLKGFSLIPDAYGGIRERHQVDFDLLIVPGDVRRAVAAVEPLGYKLDKMATSGEIRLTRHWKKHLTADSWLYDTSEGPALEFHTRLWEPESELVDFTIPHRYMSRICVGIIEGVAVPRLATAWQFVSLVLHIFRHLLDSWVRLLSLHEVAVYLRSRKMDYDLWDEVARILEHDTYLSSASALVLQLVTREFRAELPEALHNLCRLYLTADSALWCEQFSLEWLYADPPGSKLSLLIHKQFCPNADAWRAYLWRRLFPRATPPKLSDDVAMQVRRSMRYRVAEAIFRAQRACYHIASDWQFLRAAARWMRLTRSHATLPRSDRERVDQSRSRHTTQL